EDDPDTRDILQRTLEKYNWEITLAEHGQTALTRLEEGLMPDLILLDLMMPHMDGFQLVAALQSGKPEWQDIPIIILTAKDINDDDRQRLNGYVEQIVSKQGYERDDLLRTVRQLIIEQIEQINTNE
ncbi:MAG: response regulator, partial [Aggregatilineales bacterium]